MAQHLKIFTYAQTPSQPGMAGVGLVLESSNGRRWEIAENIGVATLLQAQYQAVIMALLWASEHRYRQVELWLDNPQLIDSLLHQRQVESLEVAGLHKRARRLVRSLQVRLRAYRSQPHARSRELAYAGVKEREDLSPGTAPHSHHAIQQSAGGVVCRRVNGEWQVCLISKKKGSVWSLPKGRLQSGETWESTATREILEETGHLATIAGRLDQIEYYFYWRDNHTLYYKLVTFFLMPVVKENVTPPDGEADAIAWFPWEEGWRKLYYQSEKNILRLAKARLRELYP